MTRIKEPLIGVSKLPDYKSPRSRIIRSLRKGYDNLRKKISTKSADMHSLQGKLRDTQNSREEWKIKAKKAEEKLTMLEKENQKLQELLKKRS